MAAWGGAAGAGAAGAAGRPAGAARPRAAAASASSSALHIVWAGADAPGGKFQGGAILAAMWMLAWMAGLVRPPPVTDRAAAPWRWSPAGRRLPRGRRRWAGAGGRLPGLSAGPRQAADPGGGGGADRSPSPPALALLVLGPPERARDDRDVLRPARRRAGRHRAVTACWRMPAPLRRLLAFNLLGGGVFLVFGVVARRGARRGCRATRCRRPSSSPASSSPSPRPRWPSRCCCGSPQRTRGRRGCAPPRRCGRALTREARLAARCCCWR